MLGESWDEPTHARAVLTDKLLRSLGFEAAAELAADLSCDRIWRKKMLDSESSADRAAFNESSISCAERLLPE
jgi:hypothetical protein